MLHIFWMNYCFFTVSWSWWFFFSFFFSRQLWIRTAFTADLWPLVGNRGLMVPNSCTSSPCFSRTTQISSVEKGKFTFFYWADLPSSACPSIQRASDVYCTQKRTSLLKSQAVIGWFYAIYRVSGALGFTSKRSKKSFAQLVFSIAVNWIYSCVCENPLHTSVKYPVLIIFKHSGVCPLRHLHLH